MSLSIYMEGVYEDFCGFGQLKNKAKTNSILVSPQIYSGIEKTKPILSFSVLRSPMESLRTADSVKMKMR